MDLIYNLEMCVILAVIFISHYYGNSFPALHSTWVRGAHKHLTFPLLLSDVRWREAQHGTGSPSLALYTPSGNIGSPVTVKQIHIIFINFSH